MFYEDASSSLLAERRNQFAVEGIIAARELISQVVVSHQPFDDEIHVAHRVRFFLEMKAVFQ